MKTTNMKIRSMVIMMVFMFSMLQMTMLQKADATKIDETTQTGITSGEMEFVLAEENQQNGGSPPDGYGMLTIYVHGYDDICGGWMLWHAYVSISGPEHQAGYTDSSGRIFFEMLNFGTYSITASKIGYNSGSASATLTPDDPWEEIHIWLKQKKIGGSEAVEMQSEIAQVIQMQSIQIEQQNQQQSSD